MAFLREIDTITPNNKIRGGKIDNKNIGLVKTLWELRQALDVYCIVTVNADSIKQNGAGTKFWWFVRSLCLRIISLDICKIFEDEKKQGKVKYELNSIDGVLKAIEHENLSCSDSLQTSNLFKKYGHLEGNEDTLKHLLLTVEKFKKNHKEELERFKTFRDKAIAHNEYEFSFDNLPSYDSMEKLFDFGWDFYSLVSEVIVSVGPAKLDSSRQVRVSLKKVLNACGLEDIKTEMK